MRRHGCLYTLITVAAVALAVLIILNMLGVSLPDREAVTGFFEDVRETYKARKETDKYESGDEADEADDIADEVKTSPLTELPQTDLISVELTQNKLKELLQEAADDSFPVTLDDVTIGGDSTVTFEGVMERDKFLDFVESSGNALSVIQSAALKLAPDEVNFSVTLGVTFDGDDNSIKLDPQKLSIYGLNIPVSLLPDAIMNSANNALTEFLSEYGRSPVGVELYDGYMRLLFE